MDMKLIVKPRNKKQEKTVKDFLETSEIDFTVAEEDPAPYKTAPKKALSKKEKAILENLDKSIEFVKKYKKGRTRIKSLQQLLNEL